MIRAGLVRPAAAQRNAEGHAAAVNGARPAGGLAQVQARLREPGQRVQVKVQQHAVGPTAQAHVLLVQSPLSTSPYKKPAVSLSVRDQKPTDPSQAAFVFQLIVPDLAVANVHVLNKAGCDALKLQLQYVRAKPVIVHDFRSPLGVRNTYETASQTQALFQ